LRFNALDFLGAAKAFDRKGRQEKSAKFAENINRLPKNDAGRNLPARI